MGLSSVDGVPMYCVELATTRTCSSAASTWQSNTAPKGVPFSDRALALRAGGVWKAANLTPIGLHEARHTYASLMIAAGVSVKTISTWMGHSSINITLDRYGHLLPGSAKEALGLLDGYLENALVA
jgi:integrase